MKLHTVLAAALAIGVIAGCGSRPDSGNDSSLTSQPERASVYTEKRGWTATSFAVAAANPLAAQAGYEMLKAGGSAIDAAVAVQMVLALVEPQSSGIGGGAFLLHYDGRNVAAFDGRETAPAAADERLLLGADGHPLPFYEAVVGGRAVGVPGTVRMLEQVHREYGRLPWTRLFQPAIALAEDGFKVSPRLRTLLQADPHLKKDANAAAYFYAPDGSAREVGFTLHNPALAQVLRQIAAEGSAALHEGEVARAIVGKGRDHPDNPGLLTLRDLASYQSVKREALCFAHQARRKAYRICGMPPPSSGAIAIGQILGIMDNTPAAGLLPERGLPSVDWLHLYTEAARLMHADRAQYLADPGFVQPPGAGWASLLDAAYLTGRASLIEQQPGGRSMKTAQPGLPAPVRIRYGAMPWQPESGTSHISIVDVFGNALAMTSSIEDAFGARQMTDGGSGKPGGFLLNNQLTDFSFRPADASGRPIANRVQAGKRPLSSMAPTLVFDAATGQLVMSGGSPGGALITHYTTKALYGVLHWGLDAQQAINLPNFGSLNGPTLLEDGKFPAATLDALRARGHDVRELPMTSGLQLIQKIPGGWFGGADPRREGVVRGD